MQNAATAAVYVRTVKRAAAHKIKRSRMAYAYQGVQLWLLQLAGIDDFKLNPARLAGLLRAVLLLLLVPYLHLPYLFQVLMNVFNPSQQ